MKVAVLAEGPARDAVETALLTQAGVTVTGVTATDAPIADQQHDNPHDALVIGASGDPQDVLRLIGEAVKARPGRPVVVAYGGASNGFLHEALAAGADDLIAAPDFAYAQGADTLGREISVALDKALARRSGGGGGPMSQAAPAKIGELITVLGPKGGTGKTLTSCNLAAALAAAGRRVVIVDLDLQFGDVGLALGLPPDRTIHDLAMSGGSLDAEKVADFLAIHSSGVRVLLAPRRPDHAGGITVDFLRPVLDLLRQTHDAVVIDTPPGFSPEVITAIDRSSAIVVVAMLDALSLKNTKLALETLDMMDYDRSRISVVLNRADTRVGVTSGDVTELLGREPDIRVPSDRAITRSVNEATPVVLGKQSPEARKAFEALAARFVPGAPSPSAESKAPRRRGWFRRRVVEA